MCAGRGAFVVVLTLSLAGCTSARDWLGQAATNDCVKTQCKEREAQAYQACESACFARYR
jgi:hypothetical protein